MAQSDFWTDHTIGRLRALWDEGWSTLEIGRRLGTSKNSIVGKAHRLDLPTRQSPIIRDPNAPPRAYRPPRAPKVTLPPMPAAAPILMPALAAPKPKPPPHPPAPKPMPKHRRTCQWPIGEVGTRDFRFCDAPALAGIPYCEKCAEKAYPLWRERRRSQSAAA